ncbi:MAG: L-threonylcarbamoyladenylate synthase [Lachnospiraceae bacterium]
MDTKVLFIEAADKAENDLLAAAQIIKNGGLVAFPTETVYGLGANALDEKAARKIYEAKGRPSDNPLIAHIASFTDLKPLTADIPETGRQLAKAFWPGPLTLIFPKSDMVPYGTTGGLDTIAVRMPSHPIASRLIALAGVPIAAPSANTSGRPSPTTAEHVRQDMTGRIEMIIDDGQVGIGMESTIVDVTGAVPVLLRPGAITLEMLEETVGTITVDPAILGPLSEDIKPKAPGMKYRHYAPRAELSLVEGKDGSQVTEAVISEINRLAEGRIREGYRVGILCTDETKEQYPKGVLRSAGRRTKPETIAHNLFAVLREFDDLQVDYIYSESFSREQMGQAIMNRLSKAAGYRIFYV